MMGWAQKIVGVLVATVLLSCSSEVVLDEWTTFEDHQWHMDSSVVVVWEPKNSEDPIFMSMYIRHLVDYPYNNLFLFRSIESTEGVEYTDTINVALADALGRWNGDGLSTLKTLHIPIGKGAVRFRDEERYTLRITQGMRDTVLYGIQDVGVKLEVAQQD